MAHTTAPSPVYKGKKKPGYIEGFKLKNLILMRKNRLYIGIQRIKIT